MSAHYTVGEVARWTGLTVRALHHYDEIGLVVPSDRSPSGYRLYDDDDLARIHRVLAYRELGLGLDDIAELLSDPDADLEVHLERQHELLTQRLVRLHTVLESVERALAAQQKGIGMTPSELFDVFGDDDPTQYADEADQRWGDTEAYRESHRRTSGYTKTDWVTLKEEGEQIECRFAQVMAAGEQADSMTAMDVAELHRLFVSRWFYPCSTQMHAGLAQMYVADPRFAAHYEKRAAGLAQYVHDAVLANASRGSGAG